MTLSLHERSSLGKSQPGAAVLREKGEGLLICFFFFFLIIYLFIYLFMAVLGLRFCARAFSSCGKWGPLFIAVRGPLTIVAFLCGAQAPDAQAQ